MRSNLVFFIKFVLNIIFKTNNKSVDIKNGKKRADNELKFKI